jgi:hypothetical protein
MEEQIQSASERLPYGEEKIEMAQTLGRARAAIPASEQLLNGQTAAVAVIAWRIQGIGEINPDGAQRGLISNSNSRRLDRVIKIGIAVLPVH